jgi:hypothetical protein
VLLHIIKWRYSALVRRLELTVDDELWKEMRRYPDVNWAEVIRKGIREYIRNREIRKMCTAPIDRALSQEK